MRTRFAERHATPRVAPGLKTGYTHLVRANALHERNHGGEDHPVPCRTRQLSSPSPKVLRCSPWEDRPFRSCRAFPLPRALRALFLFGAHAPRRGRSPRACGAGAAFLHRANACDVQAFVINAAICTRGSILIICSSNVFEIHRATESLIGFSYRATNSILI